MSMDIQVSSVGVEFSDTVALDGIDLSLAGDRIHGLLGRNGAGKSTLLSVMAGFRKPTAGEVFLDGMPVFENPNAMSQMCLIREVPDTLDASEKVSETLALTRRMRPSWDETLARDLLDRLDLDTGKKLGSLSRGKRAALGVVIGMATRAPVTMFDESYLGLDAPSRYVFYGAVLADFMERPRTFVISTHLIEEVASLFEEVTIIHRGRLLLQESADELTESGAEVVGPADIVDRFVADHTILASRSLGSTKAVTTTAPLDETWRRSAREGGLEVRPVPLQDLFIHLTGRGADDG